MNRKSFLKNNLYDLYDIIVIGGGITGAGIALDAASRGLKVLLLEKNDFASGTSSKSTKLIHGGLRYLKQLEFALVREVGVERAVIYDLAPHLVTPVHMVLPIYKRGNLGKYSASFALWIYDFLAKVRKEDSYKMFGKLQMHHTEPLLKKEGLIGGAIYKEYQTDDARLTIEVLKTAINYGAVCLNYAEVRKFLCNDDKITGVEFHDHIAETTHIVTARKIINASGPWVDDIRKLDEEPEGKTLHLTKGIHLVVNKNKFPLKQAVYFDVKKDKRMIFAIPRNESVYIGTTDTNYSGDKEHITILQDDISYLLDAVNNIFPSIQLQLQDVISSWAGLRPLIHQEGKLPSELSRKDEIFISNQGLISIAGGKLTGYRKMAEKVVDLICIDLKDETNIKYTNCKTVNIKIHGSDFIIPIDEYIERRAGEASQIGIEFSHVKYLVHNYGTDTEKIIDIAYQLNNEIQQAEKRIVLAELQYCVENEMVFSISDFLIRRTGRLYFDRQNAFEQLPYIAESLQFLLNYPQKIIEQQIHEFHKQAEVYSAEEIS